MDEGKIPLKVDADRSAPATGGSIPRSSALQNRGNLLVQWLMQRRPEIGLVIILAGLVTLCRAYYHGNVGDIPLYRQVADSVLDGQMPYRDQPLEYPPYVLPLFLLPDLGERTLYVETFRILAGMADLVIKFLLFTSGLRLSAGLRGLAPLCLYSVATSFIAALYLERYDVWPAVICLGAVYLFHAGRYVWSGTLIALGIGVKLYPVVFLPPLMILAARQGRWRAFFSGVVGGLVPLALCSFVMPWWHFAQYQAGRGIQVESFYASVLWLAKLLGLANVSWLHADKWYEVRGEVASRILPWARIIFVSATCISVAAASGFSRHCVKPSLARLAVILLVPLVGFIAFNPVLSPQYMIWILPLAALGSLDNEMPTMWLILLATALTPVFYPSADYYTGLNLFETIILLLRNLILLAAWALLLRKMIHDSGKAAS